MTFERELIYGVHTVVDESKVEHRLNYGLMNEDFINEQGMFDDDGKPCRVINVRYELESGITACEIERNEFRPYQGRIPSVLEFSWSDVLKMNRPNKIKMKISYESAGN